VLTLPLAIYLTRYSVAYTLLDAGFAIPVAVVLGVIALVLARHARLQRAVSLSAARGGGVATAGRILGIVGLCMGAAGLVSLGVYWLLEYAGTRN
jgi:hypothetical protein